jgi:hypothetical protein
VKGVVAGPGETQLAEVLDTAEGEAEEACESEDFAWAEVTDPSALAKVVLLVAVTEGLSHNAKARLSRVPDTQPVPRWAHGNLAGHQPLAGVGEFVDRSAELGLVKVVVEVPPAERPGTPVSVGVEVVSSRPVQRMALDL